MACFSKWEEKALHIKGRKQRTHRMLCYRMLWMIKFRNVQNETWMEKNLWWENPSKTLNKEMTPSAEEAASSGNSWGMHFLLIVLFLFTFLGNLCWLPWETGYWTRWGLDLTPMAIFIAYFLIYIAEIYALLCPLLPTSTLGSIRVR